MGPITKIDAKSPSQRTRRIAVKVLRNLDTFNQNNQPSLLWTLGIGRYVDSIA